MKDNFKKRIRDCTEKEGAIVGFNVFGYTDARTVVETAERLKRPVILMVNKDAVNKVPLEFWGMMLTYLAESSQYPVGIHLDHCSDFKVIVKAMSCGFTSVMYDGSHLPLNENIANTKEVMRIASALDIAVEGEVGCVPYYDHDDGYPQALTDTEESVFYAEESGVDWVAVSIGQIHRLPVKAARINFSKLKEIQKNVSAPLVIHGCSGITEADIRRIMPQGVGKMNYGTSVKMAFAEALKEDLEKRGEYDFVKMMDKPMDAVALEVERIFMLTEGGVQGSSL